MSKRIVIRPTYTEYLRHASTQGFLPISREAFDSVVKAGIDAIRNTWNDAESAKDLTPDDNEFNHQGK